MRTNNKFFLWVLAIVTGILTHGYSCAEDTLNIPIKEMTINQDSTVSIVVDNDGLTGMITYELYLTTDNVQTALDSEIKWRLVTRESRDFSTNSTILLIDDLPKSSETIPNPYNPDNPTILYTTLVQSRFYVVAAVGYDYNNDGTLDLINDQDNDGLPDAYELLVSKTSPYLADTDNDSIADGDEDFDDDDLLNIDEYSLFADPYNPDTDGDSLLDGVETGTGVYVDSSNMGTNPTKADTDNDGLNDNEEIMDQTFDGFETGSLNYLDWETEGDALWHVVTAEPYSGIFSAKTRDSITDDESASLILTIELTEENIFSFYYKVSSEPDKDKFFLIIDNQIKMFESGEIDWKSFSILLIPGVHTIEFIYFKDDENSIGDDCVQIDNVCFRRGTNPNITDMDGDGVPDGVEIDNNTSPFLTDTDNDGLSDFEEINSFNTNALSEDTDLDGLPDGYEIYFSYTDPNDDDSDDDQMDDSWEYANYLNQNSPDSMYDSDGDHLTNYEEYFLDSDPWNANDPVKVYISPTGNTSTGTGTSSNPYGSIQQAMDKYLTDFGYFTTNSAIFIVNNGGVTATYDISADTYLSGLGLNYLEINQDFYYFLYYGEYGTEDIYRFAIYGTDPEKVTIKAKPGQPAFAFFYGDYDYYFTSNGGDYGYWNYDTGSYTKARVIFKNLTITGASRGLDSFGSTGLITNCIFKENNSKFGSAIYVDYSNLEITNCLFMNNTSIQGAAIFLSSYSYPAIVNSTFTNNTGLEGVSIYRNGSNPDPLVINNIFWDEGDNLYNLSSDQVICCNIRDGEFEGTNGNISQDPKFGAPQFNNFHILPDSPCRNAGDNVGLFLVDLDGEYRPADSTCDIGYDEFVDTNTNNLPDFWETIYGGTYTASGDNDLDGANNAKESAFLSDPDVTDTDSDTISDGAEINTYFTNPIVDDDYDGDGLDDADEINGNGIGVPTNPLKADNDDDLLPDNYEIQQGLNPNNAADGDADNDSDGLSNYEEMLMSTDPFDINSPPVVYINQVTGDYSYNGAPYPDGTLSYPYKSLQEAMDEQASYWGGYNGTTVMFIIADGTYDIALDDYLYLSLGLDSYWIDQEFCSNTYSGDQYQCIIYGSSASNVTIQSLDIAPAFIFWLGDNFGTAPNMLKNLTILGSTNAIKSTSTSRIYISDCIIKENQSDAGCAIYAENSNFLLRNTELSGNFATKYGAAIYGKLCEFTILDSLIDNNHLPYNVATTGDNIGQGAAIYIENTSPLNYNIVIKRTTISNNQAFATGAGIYAQYTSIELDNDTFSSNFIQYSRDEDTDGYGAGIYGKGCLIEINDTNFTGNSAPNKGGGIYGKESRYYENENDTYGTLIPFYCSITNGEFQANEGDNDGGGIALEKGKLTAYNVTFSENTSISKSGAAIYLDDSGATVDSCLITGNLAAVSGGGIYAEQSDLILKNSEFTNNSAYTSSGSGGALYCELNTSTAIRDNIFTNNSATSGGAVYLKRTDPTFESNTFEANYVSHWGGALYVDNSRFTIESCLFKYNSSNSQGGAMMLYSSVNEYGSPDRYSFVDITNSVIKGNTALSGGAIYIGEFTKTDITYSVFVDNTTPSLQNGGIYLDAFSYSYPAYLSNCIFWGNSDDLEGFESEFVKFCDIEDSDFIGEYGNISEAPQFISPVNDNYHIRNTSPLIDSGTAYDSQGNDIDAEARPVTTNMYADDTLYFPRPLNNASDIGLDEFKDDDGDGLPNYWEAKYGIDLDNDSDYDNDNISNLNEHYHDSDPTLSDTDGDSIPDYAEIYVYNTNPAKDDDKDGDGLLDKEEIYDLTYGLTGYGTDPNKSDTDDDGLADKWEIDNGLNPLAVDAILDSDNDSLTNYEEFYLGTSPNNSSEPATLLASSYGSIQAAIDAASGPTIIQIGAGSFNESITLKDSICLVASNATQTFVSSQGIGPVISVIDKQNCIIKNITVHEGTYGIYCENSSIYVVNSVIRNNNNSGIYLKNAVATTKIINTDIYGNKAVYGGGIYSSNSNAEIIQCNIYNNTAQEGGGINLFYSSNISFTIANCNIVSNTAEVGGGILKSGSYLVDIVNSNIFYNTDDLTSVSEYEIRYCNIGDGDFEGLAGNISLNPEFGAYEYGKFHLSGSSPCINAGTEDIRFAVDPNGEPRRTGTSLDIGADEFLDNDGDNLGDFWELSYAANLTVLDNDGDEDTDTIINIIEYKYLSDPNSSDTDSDSLTDTQEINGFIYDSQTIFTDPTDNDMDDDSLSDGDEVNMHLTNPKKQDTDDDGIDDAWEIQYGLPATVYSSDDDSDNDGLTDMEEFRFSTLPNDGSDPATVMVGPGETYTTITQALYATSGPIIIKIQPGTYTETFGSSEKTALVGNGSSPSDVVISADTTIAGNAAIYINNTSFFIIKNLSINSSPYGIVSTSSSPIISGCIFNSNIQKTSSGGAIYAEYGSIQVSNTNFYKNMAEVSGGGLYLAYTTADLTNCTFELNATTSKNGGKGGALYAVATDLTITGCSFNNNYSTKSGGAIYADEDTKLKILRSNISNNFASQEGGGLYLYQTSESKITTSYLTNNSANTIGGAILCNSTNPKIISCAIVNNKAFENGEGIYAQSGASPIITNCILWNQFNDIYDVQESNVSYSNIKNGNFSGSNNNISSDPMFVNPENGNYHLRSDSPCINTGNLSSSDLDLDIDSETRPYNTISDIGPDEFIDADNDNMADQWELKFAANIAILDNDGNNDADTLNNFAEFTANSNPLSEDTDSDGLDDDLEVLTYKTDPLVSDTDGDSISDGEEILTYLTNPLSHDTDGDFIEDDFEISSSNLDPLNPKDADYDNDSDRLTNLEEYYLGSDNNDSNSPTLAVVTPSDDLQTEIYAGPHPKLIVLSGGNLFTAQSNETIFLPPGTALINQNGGGMVTVTTFGENPILNLTNTNVVIKNIILKYGDSAITSNNSRVLISNCQITENSKSDTTPGCGLSAIFGSVLINNSTISNNIAEGEGAGIYSKFCKLNIINSTISDNISSSKNGAGIYYESYIPIYKFSFDAYSWCYGELYKNDYLFIKDSTISNNVSGSGNGGGLFINNVPLIIKNCIIKNNKAMNGAGLNVSNADWKLIRSVVKNNEAYKSGGGIYLNYSLGTDISNSIIADNKVYGGSGDGLFDTGKSLGQITNTVIWNYLDDLVIDSSSTLSIKNCNIKDGYLEGIDGNICEEPKFIDPSSDNYHIQSTSPLIDAGSSLVDFYSDIDDESTVHGSAPDIGVDELVDSDNDNLADVWELQFAGSLSTLNNTNDYDNDSLTDVEEYNIYTDATSSDTDSDTLNDADELNSHNSNPNNADTDGDGLNDADEISNLCDPNNPDTDGDLIDDAYEVSKAFLDPLNSADASANEDSDELTNYEEYYLGSDPNSSSSPARQTVSGSTSEDIQTAIDAVAQPGIVLIGAATYNTAMLTLKDQVVLYGSSPTLTILGSPSNTTAVTIDNCSKVIIKNLKIEDAQNTAITSSKSSFMISDCEIMNNISMSNGGGIDDLYSDIKLFNTYFYYNRVNAYGGGLYLIGSNVYIDNCDFEKNRYYEIYAINAEINIKNSQFHDHYHFNGYYYSYYFSAFTLVNSSLYTDNSTFEKIYSSQAGGVINAVNSTLELRNSIFRENQSTRNGGALYTKESYCSIYNSTIFNNVSDRNGGAIYFLSSRAKLLHNVIYGNTATVGGGIFCMNTDMVEIANSILWENDDDIYNISSDMIHNCNIKDGDHNGINGNISENPLFRNTVIPDFHLLYNSPCRNTGCAVDVAITDIDNEGRPDDTLYDMGIDEFTDTDNDGLPNFWETQIGTDLDAEDDSDNDSITALNEYAYLTDPTDEDTDNDLLSDYEEIIVWETNPILDDDKDEDGISDADEIKTHGTNPATKDTDGDWMNDDYEITYGLLPLSDTDGILDNDNDGLLNREEYFISSNPSSDASPISIYVDASAADGGDGSELTPYNTISEAISNNTNATEPMVIRIAPGEYVENVSLRKYLSLLAQSKETTIWKASSLNSQLLNINDVEEGVLVKNLTFKNFYRGIYGDNTPVMVTNCDILDNMQSTSSSVYPTTGGGIYLNSCGDSIITNSIVKNNNCSQYGAGLYAANTNLIVNNSTFENNNSNNSGAGIYATSGDSFILSGSTIKNNYGTVGSGLYLTEIESSTVESTLITGNEAAVECSGLYVYKTPVNVYNTIFSNNVSNGNSGGMECLYSDSNVENCIFISNASKYNSGAAIYSYNSTINLKNSILWDEGEGSFELKNFTSSTVYNCDIKDGSFAGINGNISANPKFVNAATGNFHIFFDSDCIDAGTASSAITTDIDGEARPHNSLVDIGIDEMIDTDNDGLPNYWEDYYSTDFVPTGNNDSDSLTNEQEYAYQTNPTSNDTDSDLLDDNDEIFTHLTDPTNDDTDDDGLNDNDEINVYLSNPFVQDTDSDEMIDGWEANNGLNPALDDADSNLDGDSLTNLEEYLLTSLPNNADSPVAIYVDINAAGPGDGSAGDPYTSIQLAIDNAPSPASVIISPGVYNENLDFSNAGLIIISTPVAGTVTISGLPHEPVITSSNNDNLFLVKNIVLSDGNGGISCTKSSFIMDNCIIKNNLNSGIYLYECYDTIEIKNTTITKNTSTNGGGIWCYKSAPVLKNCIISKNEANQGGGIWASSVYRYYHLAPKILNCTIANNIASQGGGIYVEKYNTELRVKNSVIWGNGDDLYGCSIYMLSYCNIEDGDYQFNGDNIISVDPAFGAAIFGKYHITHLSGNINMGTTADLVNRDFQNETRPYGAGIDIGVDEFIDEDNDDLADYWESYYGGNFAFVDDNDNDGLSNSQEFQYFSNPLDNDTDGDNLSDGDEINMYSTDPTVSDSDEDGLNDFIEISIGTDPFNEDSDNDDIPDGWEYNYSMNPLAATDRNSDNDNDSLSNFEEYKINSEPNNDESPQLIFVFANSEDGGDGSIGTPYNSITTAIDETNPPYLFYIQGTVNETVSIDGNFIFIGANKSVSKIEGEFTTLPAVKVENITLGIFKNLTLAGGKGVLNIANSNVEIKNCIIEENVSWPSEGGGIYILGSNVSISDTSINDNSAFLYGGGLYIHSSKVNITDSIIQENTCNYDGAGLYFCSAAEVTLYNCEILENATTHYGGGTYLKQSSKLTMANTVYAKNSASVSGGAIYCYSSEPYIESCAFYKNTRVSGQGSTLFYSFPTNPVVKNTIIWSDDTYDEEEDFYGLSEALISYSDVEDATGTTNNNISVDPSFIDPENFNYHVPSDSPCVEKGSPETNYPQDVDGNLRPRGDYVDIGIDEYYNN